VASRQLHVEQHEIERALDAELEGAVAVRCDLDLEAFGDQPVGENQHETLFVFDEQDATFHVVPFFALVRRCSVNAAPPSRARCTVTRPPCASTTCLTSARPTPLPETFSDQREP